jgi:hypothetical protein
MQALGFPRGSIGFQGSTSRSAGLRRRFGANPPLIHARLLPELAGDLKRVDAGVLPPCAFVTGSMYLPMVHAAERNHEFVAGLTAECPWLHETKMMRVRGLAGAQETRLLGDEPKMFPVAIAAWRSDREDTFVDTSGLITVATLDRSLAMIEKVLTHAGVEFTNGDQPGVRLRKTSPRS